MIYWFLAVVCSAAAVVCIVAGFGAALVYQGIEAPDGSKSVGAAVRFGAGLVGGALCVWGCVDAVLAAMH